MASSNLLCKADWYALGATWERPGDFLRWLKDAGRLPSELAALVDVPQDPVWHPEGDAFEHTLHTCDAMVRICRREGIEGDRRVMFVLAMVCHDMGKAVSTVFSKEKGRWTSPGHDVSGVPIAARFLDSIETDQAAKSKILCLTRWHMAHTRKEFTEKAVRKLATGLAPSNICDLLLVMEADCNGRPPIPEGLPEVVHELVLIAKRLDVLHGSPLLGV